MRVFLLLLCMLPLFSYAGEAQDMAKDPVLEKRMVGLAEKLRCLVCQNESLASSHSPLAEDLRREVRELMQNGMSDQQIKDHLVARYGDFVLYEPPFKSFTLLLWLGPFALLAGGLCMLIFQLRKRRTTVTETVLSPAAEARVAALLNDEKR